MPVLEVLFTEVLEKYTTLDTSHNSRPFKDVKPLLHWNVPAMFSTDETSQFFRDIKSVNPHPINVSRSVFTPLIFQSFNALISRNAESHSNSDCSPVAGSRLDTLSLQADNAEISVRFLQSEKAPLILVPTDALYTIQAFYARHG